MNMHLAPDTCVTNDEVDIPISTRWHRAHGRQTRRQRAVLQQLLTPPEEKALVEHVLRLYRNGHPARVKHLQDFTWLSYETPDWHYTCSDSGYMNSDLNLYCVKNAFDPATRTRANGKPRILIIDGLSTHESLDVLTFCFDNDILICRQPSHATQKLQPCDVGVFSPLKTAYQEQVEQLYRNRAATVNKSHFAFLYSRARDIAITTRNIRSAWSKAGLYPFNPSKVLDDMQDAAVDTCAVAGPSAPKQPLLSPLSVRTPTSAIGLEALQRKLEERPGNAMDIDPYLQKLSNTAKQALDGREQADAQRRLLEDENQKLIQQNNQKKTRQDVREKKVGDAKVISHKDIVEAVRVRNRKDAEKKEKAARKERPKKVNKRQAKKRKCTATGEAEEAPHEIEGAKLSAHCSTLTYWLSIHTSD